MLTVTNFLVNAIAVVHWIFRFFVGWNYYEEKDFIVQPYSFAFEMVLLFLTVFIFIWLIKKKLWAALVYFIGYGIYYGAEIYNFVTNTTSQNFFKALLNNYNVVAAFAGLLVAFLVFIYIVSYKGKAGDKRMQSMEWFFKKGNHERNYDERADRNQYKF